MESDGLCLMLEGGIVWLMGDLLPLLQRLYELWI